MSVLTTIAFGMTVVFLLACLTDKFIARSAPIASRQIDS